MFFSAEIGVRMGHSNPRFSLPLSWLLLADGQASWHGTGRDGTLSRYLTMV